MWHRHPFETGPRAKLHHARVENLLSPRDHRRHRPGPGRRPRHRLWQARRVCGGEADRRQRSAARFGVFDPAGDLGMNAPVAADTLVPERRRLRISRNPLIAGAVSLLIALAGIAWLSAPRTSE